MTGTASDGSRALLRVGGMEQRRYQRHELRVPVRFGWQLPDGTAHQGTGISRDFSAGGLFVWTDDPPPAGATVRFEVDLETSRLDSPVNISAKGLVNRVEMSPSGFAISTRRMRLERNEPPKS